MIIVLCFRRLCGQCIQNWKNQKNALVGGDGTVIMVVGLLV